MCIGNAKSLLANTITTGAPEEAYPVSLQFEDTELSVLVIIGKEKGPTVWVESALHGDECDGSVALMTLAQTLPNELVHGTVVLCPTANPTAFANASLGSPKDGKNLNRMGVEPSDTFSARYFRWLADVISSNAQVMVDLHGGGYYLDVAPFALLPSSSAEEFARSLKLANGLEVDYLAKAPWRGELVNELSRRGLATILLENGGGSAIRPGCVARHVRNVHRVLLNLGMLEGSQETGSEAGTPAVKPDIISREHDYYFESTGVLTYHASVGTTVCKGDVVYRVTSNVTFEEEAFRCPLEKAVVLSIHTSALAIKGAYAVYLGSLS